MVKVILSLAGMICICFTNISWTDRLGDNSAIPTVEIGKGRAPTIDGIVSEREWEDATVLKLGDDGRIYLKYDSQNLYIATNSNIGNLFCHLGNRLYVYHASNSLGMSAYLYHENHRLWTCRKRYHWELSRYEIRNRSAGEWLEMVEDYLVENGWTANTKPMGRKGETEMVISLNRLGLNPVIRKGKQRVASILIGHHASNWPDGTHVSDALRALKGGNNPETLSIDSSNWGRIVLK